MALERSNADAACEQADEDVRNKVHLYDEK
jgi:hypothetical protein